MVYVWSNCCPMSRPDLWRSTPDLWSDMVNCDCSGLVEGDSNRGFIGATFFFWGSAWSIGHWLVARNTLWVSIQVGYPENPLIINVLQQEALVWAGDSGTAAWTWRSHGHPYTSRLLSGLHRMLPWWSLALPTKTCGEWCTTSTTTTPLEAEKWAWHCRSPTSFLGNCVRKASVWW